MRLVVDTNIVVAAIIRPGNTQKLLFSGFFDCHAPEHLMGEIENNRRDILRKSGFEEGFLDSVIRLVYGKITFVPLSEFVVFKLAALELCPKGHEKDWPFFALALKLECGLWSQDAALKNQKTVEVFTTGDIIRVLFY